MAEKKKKTLPQLELSAFFESLGMLLRAGVPVNECPGIIAGDMEGSPLADTARRLDHMMSDENVYVLSEALVKSGSFPDYAVEMVRLAEESGRLESTATSLGEYYLRQHSLRQSVRGAISGPLLLLVVMGVVLVFLLVLVLPVFESVFASLGLVMGGGVNSAFLVARIAIGVVGLMLLLVLALAVVYLLPGGRVRLARLAEGFALTRRIHYAISASRLTHGLEMLLGSGISAGEAVEKVSALVSNRRIASRLPACKQAVEEGEELGKALVNTGVLDGFEARVLLSASRAGQTEEAMRKLSEVYANEADSGIDRMLGLIEPSLVGILSVSIGAILLTVMIPLVTIMSAVS